MKICQKQLFLFVLKFKICHDSEGTCQSGGYDYEKYGISLGALFIVLGYMNQNNSKEELNFN